MDILSKCKTGPKKARRKMGLLMIAVFICVTFMSFGIGVASATDSSVAAQSVVSGGGGGMYPAVFGDVNGDGALDAADAILILQKIVGIIDKFPIEDEASSNIVEDALIMSFSVNNGKYSIYYYLYDDDKQIIDANPGTYNSSTNTWSDPNIDPFSAKLHENCALPGDSILNAIETFADFVIDKDGYVTSIVLKDYKKFGSKTAAGISLDEVVVDGGKVKIDGVKYSFAKTAIVTEGCNTEFSNTAGTAIASLGAKLAAGTAVAADWIAVRNAALANTIEANMIANSTYDTSDAYAVILNDDDEVVALSGYTYPTPGIVKKVIGEKVIYQTGAAPTQAVNPLKAMIANAFGMTTATLDAAMTAAGVATTIFDGLQSTTGIWDGFTVSTNFNNQDIFVEKDGCPASLSDLESLDTLSIMKNYRGCDYYLVATSTKVSGDLSYAKYVGNMVKSVNVMNMSWQMPWSNLTKTVYQGRYTNDEDTYFRLETQVLANEYDAWNTEVTLLLSATGKVAGLILAETEFSKMYGVVTDWSGDITASNGDSVQNITILRSDDKKYTYGLGVDSYLQDAATNTRTKVKDLTAGGRAADYAAAQALLMPADDRMKFTTGILVSVSRDSNNLIKTIKYWAPAVGTFIAAKDIDTDEELLKVGGTWYDAGDVTVFNLVGTDLDDTTVLGWKELKQAVGESYYAYYANSSNQLEYIVIPTAIGMSSDVKYAIYHEQYSAADDWIKFIGLDAYKVDTFVSGLKKGDIVAYQLKGGEATNVNQVIAYGTTSAWSIDTLNKGTLVLTDGEGTISYRIDSADTVYLDNSDETKLSLLSEVNVGDKVIVIDENGNLNNNTGDTAMAVVVVDRELLLPRPADPGVILSDNDNSQTYSAGDTIELVFNMDINELGVSDMSAFVLDNPDSAWDSSTVQMMNAHTYKITLGNNGDTLSLNGGDLIRVWADSTNGGRNVYFEIPELIPSIYGIITDWSGDIVASNGEVVQNVMILRSDDQKYTYSLGVDSYLQDAATNFRTKVKNLTTGGRAADYAAAQALLMPADDRIKFTTGILVSVSLDSDNLIKTIKYWAPAVGTVIAANNMDTDEELLKVGGTWYDAGDVTVFNLVGTDLDDTTVLGWKELKQAVGESFYAYYANSSNQLEYIVIPTIWGMYSDTKYAIYEQQYSNSDDWIKFVGMNAYEVDAFVSGLKKGDIVSYQLSGGKATNVRKVVEYGTRSVWSIDIINKGTLTLTNGMTRISYKIDSRDTVYLDNSNDKQLVVLDGVNETDSVIVIDENGNLNDATGDIAMAVVVVK